MKTTTMNAVMMNDVRENLATTAEEVRVFNHGFLAKAAAVVRFIFNSEEEKPFELDLSPAMKARLYL